MATYIKIATVTVGSGGAALMDFTSIPSTYTDLIVKWSGRLTSTSDVNLNLNGSSSGFTGRIVYGDGATTGSFGPTATYSGGWANLSSSTASTFSNVEIYFPNYTSSNNKSFSVDSVTENNATAVVTALIAPIWSNTAAINRITLLPVSGSFVQYSTATLYGIKNS